MAIIKQDYGSIGGGIDYSTFFNNLTYASQSGNNINYTFTVDKIYFIAYSRGSGVTDFGVTSGADVLSSGVTTISTGATSSYLMYFAIIKATSATIAIKGTSNNVAISQLD